MARLTPLARRAVGKISADHTKVGASIHLLWLVQLAICKSVASYLKDHDEEEDE